MTLAYLKRLCAPGVIFEPCLGCGEPHFTDTCYSLRTNVFYPDWMQLGSIVINLSVDGPLSTILQQYPDVLYVNRIKVQHAP